MLMVGCRVLESQALRAGLGCWRVDADSWVPPAGCCCAVGAGRFKQLKFKCWVGSGCWKCLGTPGVLQLQQDRGYGILGTPISPHPLSHSLSRSSTRTCSLTAQGHCQPLMPKAGGQGTASRSVSSGGLVLAGVIATAPCPLLFSMQVGRVSLHPAWRSTETFTSPIIAGTGPTSTGHSDGDTGHTDGDTGHTDGDTGHTDGDTGHTDADQSVSNGALEKCTEC